MQSVPRKPLSLADAMCKNKLPVWGNFFPNIVYKHVEIGVSLTTYVLI